MRILILTVGLLLPFTLAADTVNTVYLTAALSAIKQVPPVAGVDAGGDATIQVHYRRDDDGNVLYAFVTYTVNFRIPPSDAIVAMHIHEAPADRNGPIRIGSGLEFGGEPVFPEEGTGRIWRQAEIEIPRSRPGGAGPDACGSPRLLRQYPLREPPTGAAPRTTTRGRCGHDFGSTSRHRCAAGPTRSVRDVIASHWSGPWCGAARRIAAGCGQNMRRDGLPRGQVCLPP